MLGRERASSAIAGRGGGAYGTTAFLHRGLSTLAPSLFESAVLHRGLLDRALLNWALLNWALLNPSLIHRAGRNRAWGGGRCALMIAAGEGAARLRSGQAFATTLRDRARVDRRRLGMDEGGLIVDRLGETRRLGGPHIALSGPMRLVILVRLAIGRPLGVALLICVPARLICVNVLAFGVPAFLRDRHMLFVTCGGVEPRRPSQIGPSLLRLAGLDVRGQQLAARSIDGG